MKLRVLTETDVRAVMSMDEAIEVQKEAFGLLADQQVVSGLRSFVSSENPPGIAIFNPSFLKGGRGYGIKVVSDFIRNEDHGVTRMSALVALFDGQTGHPRCVMEGGYLTDLRTGAGTGLAARYLARKDSRKLALIGAGRVARNQVAALSRVCPIDTIRIATRSGARAKRLIEYLTEEDGWLPASIQTVSSAAEAVAEADIVVCATTSHQPTFSGGALRPGTFVAATGAHLPDAREVDSETIRRSSVRVIDSRDDCLENAGDLVIPIAEGVLEPKSVIELSELIQGTCPGRTQGDEITFYKSMGVPVQDLITALAIESRAVAARAGTVINMGGDYL